MLVVSVDGFIDNIVVLKPKKTSTKREALYKCILYESHCTSEGQVNVLDIPPRTFIGRLKSN